jgi:hypothetical protein
MKLTTVPDRSMRGVVHSVQPLGQRSKAPPHQFLGLNKYGWETIPHGGALLVCGEHGLACDDRACGRASVGIVLDGPQYDRVVIHTGIVAVDVRQECAEVVFANDEGFLQPTGRPIAISVGQLSLKTLVCPLYA